MTDCNPDDPTQRTQSPTRKRVKKSLSLKRKDHNEDDSRFETQLRGCNHLLERRPKSHFVSEAKDGNDDDSCFESPKKPLETYQKRFCPENTKVNTLWAVKEWAVCHNKHHSENLCPPGVLLSDDVEEMSTWL